MTRPVQRKRLAIQDRLKSIDHARSGLREVVRTEPNAQLHLIASVLALAFAFWLRIDSVRFALIVISIAMVWAAEVFNTVLEVMADLVVRPERLSKVIKRAKDMAAGGVLIASVGALLVGLIILGPPLWEQLALLMKR